MLFFRYLAFINWAHMLSDWTRTLSHVLQEMQHFLRLPNLKTPFTFRFMNLITCNLLSSGMSILIPISLLLFHKKFLFILSINITHKCMNSEPIHEKLRDTYEIQFNYNDFTCIRQDPIRPTCQFSSHFVLISSKLALVLWRSIFEHPRCMPIQLVGVIWRIFEISRLTDCWCL